MLTLQRKGRGFTLIELLVVIAIIAILAAILFPVFAKAREMARKSTCTNNMKQLALSFNMYQNDYDSMYPSAAAVGATSWTAGAVGTAGTDANFRKGRGAVPLPTNPALWKGTWPECLYPYKRNVNLIFCPSDPNAGLTATGTTVSYIVKGAFHRAWFGEGTIQGMARKEGDFEYPSDQILFYERYGWHWGDAGKGDMSNAPVAQVSLNMAFMDCHVKSMRLPQAKNTRDGTGANNEPDFYNQIAETGLAAGAGATDPRIYQDALD